jgi:hypothetical protein
LYIIRVYNGFLVYKKDTSHLIKIKKEIEEMRKVFKLSTLWLFILVIGFVLFACDELPNDDDDDPVAHVLAGEYEIDISNFGMPLVFYLKINLDGTFMLAPNRNFLETDSRGDGQLAQSGETYMMIYEGHTPETPKTATFTVDNRNLVFQTTLPYGASNIMFEAEDPDDPEIIYHLTANIIIHEELYGTYAGEHTVQAMGSSVTYTYTMVLSAGLHYEFVSHFLLGGEPYTHEEVGSWDINEDGEFVLTPDGEDAVVGSILDGVISTSVKASWMAQTRTETTLSLATHAEHAGSFVGEKTTMMYTANVTLELDMFGGYVYTADVGQPESYIETGTYEMAGSTLTLTPDEGESYEATLTNFVLEGNFKVIGAMPATALVFYHVNVQGTFTGTATHEEVEYTTTLVLNPNGTFELTITDDLDNVVITETGNFNIVRTMMVMINLVDVVPQPSIATASGGLNFNMLLPGMEPGEGMSGLGFFLTK